MLLYIKQTIMECTCELNEYKKQFHSALYQYGVKQDICRLTSDKSVKVVSFWCATCKEEKSGKVCDILTHKGTCKPCIAAQKELSITALHENVKKELQNIGLNTYIDKQELIQQVSSTFDISENKCRELYNEIPIEVWINIALDYRALVVPEQQIFCHECGHMLPKMKEGKIHVWKQHHVCDSCWCDHQDERDTLWSQVREIWGDNRACHICKKIKGKQGVRFQFDHLNMFNKQESVSTMILQGYKLEDILHEIDKCQFVCLSCHDMITEAENKLPFSQVKKNLTRGLNDGSLDEETYEKEVQKWKQLYACKMKEVYLYLQREIEIQKEKEDKCPYCLEFIYDHEVCHENINVCSYIANNTNVNLNVDVGENAMGIYKCEKCHHRVHYDCIAKDKVFQLHESREYQEDNETYESDEEDLEDPLLCPCCRHENNWHRHGVRIVSKRQNRRDNPAHVEYMIQKKFKMSAQEYVEMMTPDERSAFLKCINVNGHSIL